MLTATVERLTMDSEQLSLTEQLLSERLVLSTRSCTMPAFPANGDALAATVADPAIQHERHEIAEDFAVADADGLAAD